MMVVLRTRDTKEGVTFHAVGAPRCQAEFIYEITDDRTFRFLVYRSLAAISTILAKNCR